MTSSTNETSTTVSEASPRLSKADCFADERDRLFGLAYRMMGSVSDAEDIVQEAWIRFDPATDVRNPGAFLTTIVTRLSLDRLKSAQHRRETYIGPWLPEPLLTDRDPAHIVELDESIRLGFLHVLDTLTAVDRAVFLLHDIFDVPYAEIAQAVDRTEPNCRQIARRARHRVRADRPELATSTPPAAPTPLTDQDHTAPKGNAALLDAFLLALLSGDSDHLRTILANDVTLTSDGGAHQRAARQPVVGQDRVIRFMLNLSRRAPPGAGLELVEVNGQPGFASTLDGVPVMVVAMEFTGGLLSRVHSMLNPTKLLPARRAWVAATGGDPTTDPRIENPPSLVAATSRDLNHLRPPRSEPS